MIKQGTWYNYKYIKTYKMAAFADFDIIEEWTMGLQRGLHSPNIFLVYTCVSAF